MNDSQLIVDICSTLLSDAVIREEEALFKRIPHPYSDLLTILADDSTLLVAAINAELRTQYTCCLACAVLPEKSTPVFLEHHLWGDSYAMTVLNTEGKWSYCLSGNTVSHSMNKEGMLILVSGKTRFCNSVLVSSSAPSLLLVFTSPRDTPCQCEYPDFCHDVLIQQSMVSVPTETEEKFVYEVTSQRLVHVQVYDKIAPHFSSTRYSQWDGVQHYLDSLPANSLVLDMGCGNGKYLSTTRETGRLCLLGCDRCEELLAICREHGQEVSLVDGLFLPFRSACFDAVISIAVVHHLSTNALRRRFLQQLVRVLRPGGSALITVWAMEKDTSGKKTKSNRGYDKSDVLVGWQLQKQFSETGEEERFERYYHMFHRGELEWLLGTFPEVRVVRSWYERENWFVVIEKSCVCGTNRGTDPSHHPSAPSRAPSAPSPGAFARRSASALRPSPGRDYASRRARSLTAEGRPAAAASASCCRDCHAPGTRPAAS